MLIETIPGSRLKECDICGMQWVERFPGDFHPQYDLKQARFMIPLFCRECKEKHDSFVRRHIKRSLWNEIGVEDYGCKQTT